MVDDQNVAVEAETEPVVEETLTEAVVEETPETTETETATAARLVVKRGGVETTDIFVFGDSATIGRFDPTVGPIDVDLGTLPEGVYVSRKHAKITCEDGVWKITDLGSSNGTFLLRDDFERVDEAELADGDEIALGNARLVFHL